METERTYTGAQVQHMARGRTEEQYTRTLLAVERIIGTDADFPIPEDNMLARVLQARLREVLATVRETKTPFLKG